LLSFVNVSRLLATRAGLAAALAIATGLAVGNAASARAAQVDPTQAGVSSNWAGYVAGGTDATTGLPDAFSTVSGTWVEPKANCGSVSSTGPTSSAFWVGLGGNATSSNALEQTGTEADCTSDGTSYFAWYELVPAGSVRLALKVDPGNKISASVTVSGTHVSILMRNLSQGTTVSKTLSMADPDTSSAEWIAEAPSVCGASYSRCSEQSLTNFGTVTFSSASTESNGHAGSISDSSWSSTPIELQSGGSGGFFGAGRFAPEESVAEALPSSLTQGGSAFSITWHKLTASQPSGGFGGGGYGGGGYGGGGYAGGGYGGGGSYSI
jgi:hypothetical protein